jgi:DNA repair protein RadC
MIRENDSCYCDYVNKVIYLNGQNQILDTEDLSTGTVQSGSVSTREVFEGAIRHGAVSVIFIHNHPSGDPAPSQPDKEVTRDLVFAAAVMRVKALDHIIIGNNKYFSFAAEGLIEQYETDFLNLRVKGVSEARRKLYRARLFGEPA